MIVDNAICMRAGVGSRESLARAKRLEHRSSCRYEKIIWHVEYLLLPQILPQNRLRLSSVTSTCFMNRWRMNYQHPASFFLCMFTSSIFSALGVGIAKKASIYIYIVAYLYTNQVCRDAYFRISFVLNVHCEAEPSCSCRMPLVLRVFRVLCTSSCWAMPGYHICSPSADGQYHVDIMSSLFPFSSK